MPSPARLRRHRAVGCRQGNADQGPARPHRRSSRSRSRRRHDRSDPASRTVASTGFSPTRSSRAESRRASSSSGWRTSRGGATGRSARRWSESRTTEESASSSSSWRARSRVQDEVAGQRDDLHRRRRSRARTAPSRARDREHGGDRRSGSPSRATSSSRRIASATWCETTTSSVQRLSSQPIVECELAIAGTMSRP